ncbi:Small-conductance mechanosensitive channel [Botrimarina colliarenosi]|uniref:Small-conductance mechanosensitive channel n=1 Tax=Botrimarina colliarenosi TaxID=2528001 RepID=A0A5C6ALW3_9BACT|nr:mechanosensitive ion channel family protein [Botrimarina colliarenosi]TWU00411.1 Small-conductance mechanosensitive channel [Botrimarina colliarenosi]
MAEPSDAATADALFENAPDTPEEMTAAVTSSLGDLWESFLHRLPFLVAGLLALAVTAGVVRLVQYVVRRVLVTARVRRNLRDLILQLTGVLVWVIGITVAAVIIFPGMTPTKVITGLGIGSVALGFAFKDIVENFLAGVLILWRFPFDPGDYIVCGDVEGTVEEVTVRMTFLRHVNGELVVLPNARVFKEAVVVRTSQPVRRNTEMTGVAYEADADQAREVIRNAVASCKSVVDDRPVEVFLHCLGSSSVDFAVSWWSGARPVDERSSRDEVLTAVKRALGEADIEIPWPQQVVTFKNGLALERARAEE